MFDKWNIWDILDDLETFDIFLKHFVHFVMKTLDLYWQQRKVKRKIGNDLEIFWKSLRDKLKHLEKIKKHEKSKVFRLIYKN